MTQTEMFPPFQSHSITSIDAAIAIEPRVASLRDQVYAFIAKCGAEGATDDEIQAALQINPSTQRPRRIELANKGKIKRTETTRKTRSGRSAVVWVVR